MKKIIVDKLLNELAPISLPGLDKVKLLNRIDRKYIIPVSNLQGIIEVLKKNEYSVLEIEGKRSFSYLTTYYDSPDFQFYQDHHNQLTSRIKARTRSYLESNLHFFEIKMKNNIRTKKVREKLTGPGSVLTISQSDKIKELYSKELDGPLQTTLVNRYNRVTLVNKAQTERCTIDVNLTYTAPENPGKEISVNEIAIIEIKQSKTSLLNGIIASLRNMQVYPSSISKYVLGLILTHPEIKHNTFKPLLQLINKIKTQQQTIHQNLNFKHYEKVSIPAARVYSF